MICTYPNIYKLKHIANDNVPMTQDQHIDYLWDLVFNNLESMVR